MSIVHSYHDVVIVGGGISGLTTAWWLSKSGTDVIVLEKKDRPGGTMQTVQEDGWLVETGPNSALLTSSLFHKLFDELELSQEVVYANAEADNRYILRDGVLHSLPMGPVSFLRTKLFSPQAKLRLMKEPFIDRGTKEETIAEFVERRLGREFLDYAINPFVAGVFAGNPEQLSVRTAFPKLYALEEKYGGLIKGMVKGRKERKQRDEIAKDRARMFSFKHGMETLPATISHKLGDRVLLGAQVTNIELHRDVDPPYFLVHYSRGENEIGAVTATSVVLSAPASASAELLRTVHPDLAQLLRTIYYPPVAEIFFGYKTKNIPRPLDGFGFLIPAKEKRKILGTIWSSAIFPDRAPKEHSALTTFVGGSRQPEVLDVSDEALIELVREELKSIMGITVPPVFIRIHQWKHAIPQYNIGYQNILDAITVMERDIPGLFICSNFRGGISVSDCVANAEKTFGHVISHLTRYKP